MRHRIHRVAQQNAIHRNLSSAYPGIAVVAGSSEGLGAAFSRALARAGCDVLLVARRPDPLRRLAEELAAGGARVRTLECDLAAVDAVTRIEAAAGDTPIGLVVYNAAVAPLGPFGSLDEGTLDALVNVNMRTPLMLARRLAARGRAGGGQPASTAAENTGRRALVIVSSMAGWQGGPLLSAYSASKAFLRVLGEGLWDELRHDGMDVVVTVPGATDTPGYRAQSGKSGPGPGVLSPERVANAALRALGRRPVCVPGALYKMSQFFMTRILPRRVAIRIMGTADRRLASRRP